MGFGSSLKKGVKSVAKSVKTVVKAPVKVVQSVVKGDLSQAGKEIAKGAAAGVNAQTFGVLQSGEVRSLAKNDTVNALTFNTGKEIARYGEGLGKLEKTGEANSDFYQSWAALGAKVGGAAYLAGTTGGIKGAVTAKNYGTATLARNLAGSGDYAGAAAAIAGAGGYSGVSDFLTQVSNQQGSSANYSSPQSYASDFYDEPASSGPSVSQLMIWSALAAGAVFLVKRGI